MARSRSIALFFVITLTFTALGGCLTDEAGPASSPSPSTSSATTGNTTTPTGTNASTNSSGSAQAPVAAFTVAPANASQANISAGVELLFDAANSSDPAGGNLSFAWEFGDNETAEGALVNHTFAEAGNYTIVLTVTSSASGASSNASQLLAVGVAEITLPESVSFTDPTGDGSANYLDLKTVKISRDEENLVLLIGVGAVCPCNQVDSVFLIDFFVNGNRFEIYAFGGPLTLYDQTNGEDVPGAAVRIAGTAFEVKLPLSYLEEDIDKPAPWSIYTESYVGEGFAAGQVADDRGPDTGTVTFG